MTPHVYTESSPSSHASVVNITWRTSSPHDGTWSIDWDSMYSDLSSDLSSARSEQGSYSALQREGEVLSSSDNLPAITASPPSVTVDAATPTPRQAEHAHTDPLMTAPLSTAKLLAFENGLDMNSMEEDLPAFFASRPIVRAPEQIEPAAESDNSFSVFFLLAPEAVLPGAVRIYFTPTWSSSSTAPSLYAEIPVSSFEKRTQLFSAWAEARLADLKALAEIARELEEEGSRGTGTGRVKIGVEGGGMDEEAVRREAFLVGEEMSWVRETFLTEKKETSFGEGLGLVGGLQGRRQSEVVREKHVEEEEKEEELFALPLSPRSPDMEMSPFSAFRGEVVGTPGKKEVGF